MFTFLGEVFEDLDLFRMREEGGGKLHAEVIPSEIIEFSLVQSFKIHKWKFGLDPPPLQKMGPD